MASPAPYSKPKRRIFNRKTLKFSTRKGSFIYAPVPGKLIWAKGGVVIKTESGSVHTISGVTGSRMKRVKAGERIGKATGNSIVYTKRDHKTIVDAMPVVLRPSGLKPERWMPGVKQIHASGDAGVMGPGNEVKVVWHTSESGNDHNAIYGVAAWVKQQQSEYTICWNPYTGQFIQLFPAEVGARAVMNGYSLPANRHGKICIQVCVIGRGANAPLAKSPMKGRRELMEWLDSWGVPRDVITSDARSIARWKMSGHTTHRSAPRPNDHTDPGRVNWQKLLAP